MTLTGTRHFALEYYVRGKEDLACVEVLVTYNFRPGSDDHYSPLHGWSPGGSAEWEFDKAERLLPDGTYVPLMPNEWLSDWADEQLKACDLDDVVQGLPERGED